MVKEFPEGVTVIIPCGVIEGFGILILKVFVPGLEKAGATAGVFEIATAVCGTLMLYEFPASVVVTAAPEDTTDAFETGTCIL